MHKIKYKLFEKSCIDSTIILDFFKKNDDALIPHISERVNLFDYSNRLSEKAIHFTAFKNGKLVGILSLYFNQFPKFSFCPYFCVNKNYTGQSIGNTLLKMAIDYCILNNSFGIKLTVNKDNLYVIKFYKKNDFYSIEEGFYPNSDKKHLLMGKKLNER